MCCKLRPVVGGYGPYRHPAPFEWSLRRHEPVGRTAFPNRVFPWAWNIFPFPLRLQLPLAVLSYDHVHLPVTPHSLSVGMCGPVVNRNTVWDWYPCTRGGTSLRSPSVPEILADVILTDEFKDSTADVRGIWSGCRAFWPCDAWLNAARRPSYTPYTLELRLFSRETVLTQTPIVLAMKLSEHFFCSNTLIVYLCSEVNCLYITIQN